MASWPCAKPSGPGGSPVAWLQVGGCRGPPPLAAGAVASLLCLPACQAHLMPLAVAPVAVPDVARTLPGLTRVPGAPPAPSLDHLCTLSCPPGSRDLPTL